MSTIDYSLLAYALFVTVASFVHLIPLEQWWIRVWDFPHLQLALMAALGLLVWAVLGHPMEGYRLVIPLGLMASLGYHAWLVYPFTPLHRQQIHSFQPERTPDREQDQTIRIMTTNVLMENRKTPEMLQMILQQQPDVLLVLEANQRWQDGLAELEASYPHRILHPLENTYGMLLYSRLPIRSHELRFLIQDDIPSIYAQLELPSGQPVHFYGVHPMPPSPTEHHRSTERDAELLLVGKEARAKSGPIVVAGDLNDVAWSHTTRLFQRISGLLDPRIGRGLFNTFHAHYFFLRWPLDHVFVSEHFQLKSMRCLPNCGSDHFPILVSLVYVGEEQAEEVEIPQPKGNDVKEAREKINEAQ